jgi:hypothetical protein
MRYCKKLHNEELYDLYLSPNFGVEIKSKMMRWAVHVTCVGEKRCIEGVCWKT